MQGSFASQGDAGAITNEHVQYGAQWKRLGNDGVNELLGSSETIAKT
ncbi:MAG TPA: hypothetical protein VMW38_04670 [Terriglobia bacterium]|nr:hypothetical protein [Terriglobia bacterium]